MSIVSPILPIYAKSFQVSFAVASLAITVYALGRLVADIPVGILADKVGRRPMMLGGCVVITAMALANANAPNFAWFIVFRFFQGVGSSMWMTSRTTLLADILRPEERGRIMGYFQAFMLIGQSAGPSFGGWIATYYGLTAPFYFYAATGLLTTILTFFLIFEPKGLIKKEGEGKHLFSFKEASGLFRNQTYAMACFAIFTVTFQRSGIRTNMIPLYVIDDLGMDEMAVGTILSYATLANLLVTVPMGYAIDLLGRKPVIVWNMILLAIANLSFIYAKDYWTISLAAVVLGLASAGAGQAPQSLAIDATPNERKGLAMGVYRLANDVGSMLGPVILSSIADFTNLRTPFYVMTGVLIFNALMIAIFAKEIIKTRFNKGS
jgi:DHA1 family multidrug resistance protein-like MFS transporter